MAWKALDWEGLPFDFWDLYTVQARTSLFLDCLNVEPVYFLDSCELPFARLTKSRGHHAVLAVMVGVHCGLDNLTFSEL